jgi:TP901 family phage tail tape measure protein
VPNTEYRVSFRGDQGNLQQFISSIGSGLGRGIRQAYQAAAVNPARSATSGASSELSGTRNVTTSIDAYNRTVTQSGQVFHRFVTGWIADVRALDAAATKLNSKLASTGGITSGATRNTGIRMSNLVPAGYGEFIDADYTNRPTSYDAMLRANKALNTPLSRRVVIPPRYIPERTLASGEKVGGRTTLGGAYSPPPMSYIQAKERSDLVRTGLDIRSKARLDAIAAYSEERSAQIDSSLGNLLNEHNKVITRVSKANQKIARNIRGINWGNIQDKDIKTSELEQIRGNLQGRGVAALNFNNPKQMLAAAQADVNVRREIIKELWSIRGGTANVAEATAATALYAPKIATLKQEQLTLEGEVTAATEAELAKQLKANQKMDAHNTRLQSIYAGPLGVAKAAETAAPPVPTDLGTVLKSSKALQKDFMKSFGITSPMFGATGEFTEGFKKQLNAMELTANASRDFEKGMVSLGGTVKSVDGLVGNWSYTLDKNGQLVQTWGRSLRGVGGFMPQVARDFQKVVEWTIATTVVFGSLAAVLGSFTKINQVNNDLQRFQITAKTTGEETKAAFDTIANVAIKTATPLMDLTAVMDDIALATRKMGQSSQEWMKNIGNMAEAAGILTNITGIDTVKGVDMLTSAYKQLGITTDDLIPLLSKVSAVAGGNAQAIEDIMQAIGGLAEAAKGAGLTVDQQIGAVQTLSQVTNKTAADTATAFKNLFGAINAPASEKFLKNFGIEIRNAAGGLKPFLAIYGEIYAKIQSGAISQGRLQDLYRAISGGPRRAPDAAAFLNNFPKIMEAIDIATGSTNEALIANAKIMQTNNAKLQQLRSQFDATLIEKFTDAVNKLVAALVNMGNFLSGIFGAFPDQLVTIALQLAIIATSVSLLKKGFGFLAPMIANITGLFKGMGSAAAIAATATGTEAEQLAVWNAASKSFGGGAGGGGVALAAGTAARNRAIERSIPLNEPTNSPGGWIYQRSTPGKLSRERILMGSVGRYTPPDPYAAAMQADPYLMSLGRQLPVTSPAYRQYQMPLGGGSVPWQTLPASDPRLLGLRSQLPSTFQSANMSSGYGQFSEYGRNFPKINMLPTLPLKEQQVYPTLFRTARIEELQLESGASKALATPISTSITGALSKVASSGIVRGGLAGLAVGGAAAVAGAATGGNSGLQTVGSLAQMGGMGLMMVPGAAPAGLALMGLGTAIGFLSGEAAKGEDELLKVKSAVYDTTQSMNDAVRIQITAQDAQATNEKTMKRLLATTNRTAAEEEALNAAREAYVKSTYDLATARQVLNDKEKELLDLLPQLGTEYEKYIGQLKSGLGGQYRQDLYEQVSADILGQKAIPYLPNVGDYFKRGTGETIFGPPPVPSGNQDLTPTRELVDAILKNPNEDQWKAVIDNLKYFSSIEEQTRSEALNVRTGFTVTPEYINTALAAFQNAPAEVRSTDEFRAAIEMFGQFVMDFGNLSPEAQAKWGTEAFKTNVMLGAASGKYQGSELANLNARGLLSTYMNQGFTLPSTPKAGGRSGRELEINKQNLAGNVRSLLAGGTTEITKEEAKKAFDAFLNSGSTVANDLRESFAVGGVQTYDEAFKQWIDTAGQGQVIVKGVNDEIAKGTAEIEDQIAAQELLNSLRDSYASNLRNYGQQLLDLDSKLASGDITQGYYNKATGQVNALMGANRDLFNVLKSEGEGTLKAFAASLKDINGLQGIQFENVNQLQAAVMGWIGQLNLAPSAIDSVTNAMLTMLKALEVIAAYPDIVKTITVHIQEEYAKGRGGTGFAVADDEKALNDAREEYEKQKLAYEKALADLLKYGKASDYVNTPSGSTASNTTGNLDVPKEWKAASVDVKATLAQAVAWAKQYQSAIPGENKAHVKDLVAVMDGNKRVLLQRGIGEEYLRKAMDALTEEIKKQNDLLAKADMLSRIRVGAGDFAAMANVPLNSKSGVSVGGPQGPVSVNLDINGQLLTPAQFDILANKIAAALKSQLTA